MPPVYYLHICKSRWLYFRIIYGSIFLTALKLRPTENGPVLSLIWAHDTGRNQFISVSSVGMIKIQLRVPSELLFFMTWNWNPTRFGKEQDTSVFPFW